jgi:hypothetical protein
MNKIIGVTLLAVGIFLLVQGHNMSRSVVSQAQQLVVGSVPDKVMWYYISGAICCAVGLMQIFRPGKK